MSDQREMRAAEQSTGALDALRIILCVLCCSALAFAGHTLPF